MQSPATLELGPSNWFEAWWLVGQQRVATRLAVDPDGRHQLLSLPSDELKYVESVLARAWCEGPREWDAPEWADLQALSEQALARLDAERSAPSAVAGTPRARLDWPPSPHAVLGAGPAALLLDEAWRLERHDGFTKWLVGVSGARGFAGRARVELQLRRLAVEVARRAPSARVFETLRWIYRDPSTREDVVAADERYFAAANAGTFRATVEELGLHAPFSTERFPAVEATQVAVAPVAPRVTVLIPAYRHEAYVERAIASCLGQSIADVRVLLVDDRSPDGTVAAARAIVDPRLTVTVNEHNLGLGGSILAALPRIDTPFVALLNSDDLFHPERLARCVEVLEGDTDAMLVATGIATVDAHDVLLTPSASCAVEVGPNAHAWLRWFDRIVRDEIRTVADWTSFELLLRHNVLATSSNMVFRTEWLRSRMPDASTLKYCVDWQLFLEAAAEGSLRMVDLPLIAYRLHDANTVWFRPAGMADYVIEVNRVVDRVLQGWFDRTAARDGAPAATERLAGLLQEHVRMHGETDGTALYLVQHARRVAAGVDATTGPVRRLVDAALRRKRYRDVIEQLDVDPWTLAWRIELSERWRLERDVADGYAARARSLAQIGSSLRVDVAALQQSIEAVRTERDLGLTRIATLQAEHDALRQLRVDDQHELAARAEALARSSAALDEARSTVDRQLAELDLARADAQRARAELARVSGELRAENARLADDLAAQRDAGHALERELGSTRTRLEAARDEATRAQRIVDRAIRQALQRGAELAAHTASPAWRLGHVTMRKAGVLGAYKTATAAARFVRAIAQRGTWHARRVAATRAGNRAAVAVYVDAHAHGEPDLRLPVDARDGSLLRLIAFARDFEAAARRSLAANELDDDRRLVTADRAYFEKRNAAGVAEVERLFGDTRWLPRAWRAVRAVKCIGAGTTVAQGLRGGAVQSYGSKRLCGTRSVLLLGDEDLIAPAFSGAAIAAVLRATDLVVADSELVLRAAERLAEAPLVHGLVRWAVAVRPATASARGDGVRVFVHWPATMRADPVTLLGGVRRAVSAGAQLSLDVVGALGDGVEGLRRWLELEDHILRSGLAGCVQLHGHVDRVRREELMARADLVTWIGRSAEAAGLPRAVIDGIASAKCVIASAVPELLWCPALAEHVTLVAPGDEHALAVALTSFPLQRDTAESKARAGRELMHRRAADAPAWTALPRDPAGAPIR